MRPCGLKIDAFALGMELRVNRSKLQKCNWGINIKSHIEVCENLCFLCIYVV
jgi:hypothetical protein